MIPPRLTAAMRYLSWAGAPHLWRLAKAECPNCGNSVFISLRKDPFMTRCIKCTANVTNLSLIPVIRNHFAASGMEKVAYELSTYGSTLQWLNNNFKNVITSEFIPGEAFGECVNGVLNQDIQQLTFDDDSIDLITSNQVFEHVPDDIKGYSECFRVLRKGGALVFSVPMFEIESTRRIATIDNGNITFLGTPEYHDSRCGGAKSAPVFWHHSVHDLADRVKKAGFPEAELVDIVIATAQGTPSRVLYAKK